jgi:signal transduction histidine kinase
VAYEIGLLCTLVLGLWVLVEVGGALPRRLQALPSLLLGVSSALWAGGELLIYFAAGSAEVLQGRRLLYLGSGLLPVAWLWTAADAARARWLMRGPWLLALPALAQAMIYACLYTDAHAWFVHGTAQPPRFGPLFWAHAGIGWSLVVLGTGYFVLAAIRLGKGSPLRMLVIAVGTTLPLLANLIYLTTGLFQTYPDPTPIVLAVSIFVIRAAAIDSGLTAFLPAARLDVIQQLRSGVVVTNTEGRIVDANPAAARMLSETELAGASLERVLARSQSEGTRAIEVQSFPLKGLFGAVGCCNVLNDRTEARRIERQLHQAQKLEAIGYLTAGIAHAINNPLAFLQSNLRGLEELAQANTHPVVQQALGPKYADLAAEAPELVVEMRDGLDRIERLVESLMGFTSSSSPGEELVKVDLHEVAIKAGELAAVGVASDAIRTHLAPVPPILGCEGDLVQIGTNLLLNAIEASGETADIELAVLCQRGQVTLTVRDHGPGIPTDSLSHVFDPFFTTKGPGDGVGLGLSFSFDLARRHGGTLEAANHPDGGALFTLWLPPAPGTEACGEVLEP